MPLILQIRHFINIQYTKVQSNPLWPLLNSLLLSLSSLSLSLAASAVIVVCCVAVATHLWDGFIKFGQVSSKGPYYSIKYCQAAGRLAQFCLNDFPWHSSVAVVLHMALRATCSLERIYWQENSLDTRPCCMMLYNIHVLWNKTCLYEKNHPTTVPFQEHHFKARPSRDIIFKKEV